LGQGVGLGSTDSDHGDVAIWAGAIVTTYVGGRSLERSPGASAPSGAAMSARRNPKGRVAVLEQRVIRVETELARM
jgi:hypothetical protein